MSQTDSPCQTICKLDEHKRLCIGCGRTLDEIAAWPTASEAERQAILEKLPERFTHLLSEQFPTEKF